MVKIKTVVIILKILNKTKHLPVEHELKKLKIFDSSYFFGKSHFEDGTQNYLIFQPMYRYFEIIAGIGNRKYIYYWKSKGLSNERISSIAASNCSVTPFLDYYGTKTRVEFWFFVTTGLGQNVIIFGVDMSSSTKIDNRKKDILILGKGPTQGLEHTLSAEKMYSINFTVTRKKFCLSLHHNGANSY